MREMNCGGCWDVRHDAFRARAQADINARWSPQAGDFVEFLNGERYRIGTVWNQPDQFQCLLNGSFQVRPWHAFNASSSSLSSRRLSCEAHGTLYSPLNTSYLRPSGVKARGNVYFLESTGEMYPRERKIFTMLDFKIWECSLSVSEARIF